MTFSKPWLGSKRVAFVPLFRTNAAPPDQIPPDWENVILRRVVNDPRPEAGGADRSLRAWLRAVSWGRADIDPLVLPMQTITKQHVEADELEGTLGVQLRAQGVESAVLVMLGGRGAATNLGFWSRVVMVESNGAWLMELIHGLTGFKDLYHFNNDADPPESAIDTFDEMSAASQTHPTAFTKNELGWLDAAPPSIGLYISGASLRGFILHHVSSGPLPPTHSNASFAVRIGDGFPYVMVEARKKTDQFEAGMPSTGDGQERGIASEGVIAYRVQTRNPTVQEREGNKKPLFLMTLTGGKPVGLQVGESRELDNGVIMKVVQTIPATQNFTGGFIIHLTSNGGGGGGGGTNEVIVPHVIQEFAAQASDAVIAAGLVPKFTNSGSWVFSQSPAGGRTVPRGSTVTMTLRTGPLP